jgi:CheY-like chemotaxis protein
MVYGVVKNHGGHVTAYSEKGEGATFRVYLPANGKTEKLGVSDLSAYETARGENELILVVDDEESIRSLVQDTLEGCGYRVLTAENGLKAIETYGSHKDEIGLVILDMVMPRMGGGETFLKLKEMNPKVRALLSTGYSENGRAREILDTGVMGFLQKPYRVMALISKVRVALDSGK